MFKNEGFLNHFENIENIKQYRDVRTTKRNAMVKYILIIMKL